MTESKLNLKWSASPDIKESDFAAIQAAQEHAIALAIEKRDSIHSVITEIAKTAELKVRPYIIQSLERHGLKYDDLRSEMEKRLRSRLVKPGDQRQMDEQFRARFGKAIAEGIAAAEAEIVASQKALVVALTAPSAATLVRIGALIYRQTTRPPTNQSIPHQSKDGGVN